MIPVLINRYRNLLLFEKTVLFNQNSLYLYSIKTNIMKTITIFEVEGATRKRGLKQNKTYSVISEDENWFKSKDEKGRFYDIWNVKGDWSLVGIKRDGISRMSYTKDFTKNF